MVSLTTAQHEVQFVKAFFAGGDALTRTWTELLRDKLMFHARALRDELQAALWERGGVQVDALLQRTELGNHGLYSGHPPFTAVPPPGGASFALPQQDAPMTFRKDLSYGSAFCTLVREPLPAPVPTPRAQGKTISRMPHAKVENAIARMVVNQQSDEAGQ